MKPKDANKKRSRMKKTGKRKRAKLGPRKKPVIALPAVWER